VAASSSLDESMVTASSDDFPSLHGFNMLSSLYRSLLLQVLLLLALLEFPRMFFFVSRVGDGTSGVLKRIRFVDCCCREAKLFWAASFAFLVKFKCMP